jgi:hypothetical protein
LASHLAKRRYGGKYPSPAGYSRHRYLLSAPSMPGVSEKETIIVEPSGMGCFLRALEVDEECAPRLGDARSVCLFRCLPFAGFVVASRDAHPRAANNQGESNPCIARRVICWLIGIKRTPFDDTARRVNVHERAEKQAPAPGRRSGGSEGEASCRSTPPRTRLLAVRIAGTDTT